MKPAFHLWLGVLAVLIGYCAAGLWLVTSQHVDMKMLRVWVLSTGLIIAGVSVLAYVLPFTF